MVMGKNENQNYGTVLLWCSTLGCLCLVWRGDLLQKQWKCHRIRIPPGSLKPKKTELLVEELLSQLPRTCCRHRACEQGACPALGQEAARPPFSLRPGWWHLAVLLAGGSCAVISWKRRISPVRALSASRWFASLGSGEFLLTCTLSPPKNVTLD